MPESNSILIIDDETRIRNVLADILHRKGFHALTAENGEKGLKYIRENHVDVVLLDLMMPQMNGLEVLKKITELDSTVQTIIITAHGSVETAVEAMKIGAYDYIEKPMDVDRILVMIKNALEKLRLLRENQRLRDNILARYRLIGNSKVMTEIREKIQILAPQTCTVMITGQTGTGKDLVARSLHNLSSRLAGPFVKVNCAAIPKDLMESELFGHQKGAFTGALHDKPGLFEQAHGGTIFLDEIGDLPLHLQAKLLQVLEEKTFHRIGSNKEVRVDVRVIAATNKDIQAEVQHNRFRADLFYRLNIASIHLPPLREHAEDIPELARHFIAMHCEEMNIPQKSITPDALHLLMDYEWPGNIRELKHRLQEMLIYLQDDQLDAAYVNEWLDKTQPESYVKSTTLRQARENFERDYIRKALIAHNWDIPKTAEYLGIERTNLYRKMRGLGMKKE